MIITATQIFPIIYGEGAAQQTGAEAKNFGITKALIVCDQGIKGAGIVDPIIKNLNDEGIVTVLFDKVQADPPDFIVEEAGALAVKEKVDGVVAIGGGSSIDTAKGANILINNPPPINQWSPPNFPQGEGVPFIAIPTTAGTGSEVTDAAVITGAEAHQKMAVMLPFNTKRLSIIDPVMYVGLPPKPTVYTAFDAYTHAVDGIISNVEDPFAIMYAKEAIRIIHKYLPMVLENGQDLEARGGLALAATLGGLTLRGSVAHLTHSIGHSFGSYFHMPHGLACGVCLPQLFELYAEILPERTKIVAEAMGLSLPDDISNNELGKETSSAALAFMKQNQLPTLKELGYTLENLYEAVPMMLNDVTRMFTPIKSQPQAKKYKLMIWSDINRPLQLPMQPPAFPCILF